jgi:hypothetical protein
MAYALNATHTVSAPVAYMPGLVPIFFRSILHSIYGALRGVELGHACVIATRPSPGLLTCIHARLKAPAVGLD